MLPTYVRGVLHRASAVGGPRVCAVTADEGRIVHVYGPPAAAARGAAAVRAALVPAATLRVRDTWGHLIDSGAFSSERDLAEKITGRDWESARQAAWKATGAAVHASHDRLVIFVHGSATQAAAARVVLDATVVPAATLSVGAEWGDLLGGTAYPTAGAVLDALRGTGGLHYRRVKAECGVSILYSHARGVVFLWGAPGAVAAARARMDAIVRAPPVT